MSRHDHVAAAPILKALNAVDESTALEAIEMWAKSSSRDGHELLEEAAYVCRFATVDPSEATANNLYNLSKAVSEYIDYYDFRLYADEDGIARRVS